MDRMFFEERQKLAAVWSWVVLLSGLALTSPLLVILFNQLVVNHEPESNTKSLIVALCLALILVGVLVWLTASFYLEVKIGRSGIYFQYFPYHFSLHHIDVKAISGYVIRKLHWKEVFESRREKSWKTKRTTQIYTVAGKTVLELALSDDKKIILGIQNKESVTWAMKRLLDNPA